MLRSRRRVMNLPAEWLNAGTQKGGQFDGKGGLPRPGRRYCVTSSPGGRAMAP